MEIKYSKFPDIVYLLDQNEIDFATLRNVSAFDV